jgi:hypothetical protein
MSFDVAKEFLEARNWQVWDWLDGEYQLIRPGGTSALYRDACGLVLLAEAVKQAELEARQC